MLRVWEHLEKVMEYRQLNVNGKKFVSSSHPIAKCGRKRAFMWKKKKICWEYDVPSLPVAVLLWRNLLPPRLAVGLAACP